MYSTVLQLYPSLHLRSAGDYILHMRQLRLENLRSMFRPQYMELTPLGAYLTLPCSKWPIGHQGIGGDEPTFFATSKPNYSEHR